MEKEELKGILKINDRCNHFEYCSSQLSIHDYELPIRKGEVVVLKDHMFNGRFIIKDIISNDEIVIIVDNLPEASIKRGETKVFEDSDSCGEGEHFEACRFELTVSFLDE